MTRKVFTLGYAGKTIEELQRIIEELDAVIFDVRFSPRSRNPVWNRGRLEAALGPERYRHVQALGNRNYKSGSIEIVDLEAGVAAIQAAERPVILLCVCSDPRMCHRTFVGDHLRALGFQVEVLNDLPPAQRRLL